MSIAEKFEVIADEVYEKGIEKGIEKGKKDEHDNFWDVYQNYGNRTFYAFGFTGEGWNDTSFRPKHSIIINNNAEQMFRYSNITNLENILNNNHVVLNTNGVTSFFYTFAYSNLTAIPEIDTRSCNHLDSVFCNSINLKTIRKLILREDGSQTYGFCFAGCSELEDLIVEGVIGKGGFDVSYSPKLTVASLLSILTTLSKDNNIVNNATVTFAKEHEDIIKEDSFCVAQFQLAEKAGWDIQFVSRA